MKVFGCVLGIIGLLMCIAGGVMFGVIAARAMDARVVKSIPIQIGEAVHTGNLKVDTSKFCMVTLKAVIHSDHSHRKTGTNNKEEYELEYKFPFRYRVLDSAGKELFSEEATEVSSGSGTRSYSHQSVNKNGGSVDVETSFEKFPVASPGEIQVEAQIEADEQYSAQLEKPQLIVYDNVSKHAKTVGAGVGLLIVGGVLGFIGVLLFVVALARGSGNSKTSPQSL